jgi:hypothetical protein
MLDFGANVKSALVGALAEMSGLELVVGSRGHGGFASALLGSVSMYCVLHAHCPVLVLRDGREGSQVPRAAKHS